MKTADQIIQEGVAAGRPASDIQAELRRGYENKDITVNMAIQALAIQAEEQVRLMVNLFAEALKLLGAEVNSEGMANAYLESLRLAQDAFFYDVLSGPPTDEDGFVYEATLVGEEE